MLSYNAFDISKSFENLEKIKDLYLSSSISPKLLLSSIYDSGVGVREYKDFFNTSEILAKLKQVNAELVEFVETKSISKEKNIESEYESFNESDKHYLFFYRDNLIRVDLNEEISLNSKVKEKCTLLFYFPVSKECADKIFLEHILKNVEPSVYILNQEYGEFAFSKFSVMLPKSIDLDLNYGKGFKKTNNLIIDSINNNHSGLYMFHGPPGTGKSTYIKYLSTVLKKDVIFFPTAMVNSLTDPNIINLLIRKQNCVLVLEDAEKAIIKRESNSEASLVSTLLNMTDGILGDVLKLNIIVTYNCDRGDIDEALLRRGRLKAEHSFKLLDKEQAKKLINHLKLDIEVEEDMSLADIYNFKKEEELIGNREELNKKKVIGFNS
jgi:hypothetical protein